MKTILAATALVLGLAASAAAQSANVSPSDPNLSLDQGVVRSGSEAVGDASILPSTGGTVDSSTTQSVSPGGSLPGAPNTSLSDAVLPSVGQPTGATIDGTISPRSSGNIPGTVNNRSVRPGATTTGPAAGGNGAF